MMDIKIRGWSSKGFRCPDVSLDLLSDSGDIADVSFIQMPNGTGKTTTLTLLRAALSGEAENWKNEEIKQLRKHAGIVRLGEFTLHLDLNGELLSFQLVVDFENCEVTYNTSSPLIGGTLKGWSPPNSLKPFLNTKFIKLFIFDGELAEKLLNDEFSEATEAIDALFQLYLINDIKFEGQDFWKRTAKKSSGGSQKKRTALEQELANLEAHKIELIRKKNIGIEKRKNNSDRIHKLTIKIDSRISSVKKYRNDYDELRESSKEAELKVLDHAKNSIDAIRNPAYFDEKITRQFKQLKDSLDTLRLPANTSQQFFIELSHNDHCVCGRPIGQDEKASIIHHSSKYLSNEIAGFLNSLKVQISELESSNFDQIELERSVNDLSTELDNRDKINVGIRRISQLLQDSGDEELKELEKERTDLRNENLTLDKLLIELDTEVSTDPLTSRSIISVKKRIESINNEISEISGTVDLKKKIEILDKILDSVYSISKEELKIKILNKFRDRVSSTLPFNPISIESIENHIKLENQDGASAGQTLSIAYCYLTTLLHWGTQSFPLVVDSPSGKIDFTVRRELAKFIPELTDQFIAFVIPPEINHFVDEMKRTSSIKTKSLTVLRKTEYSDTRVSQANPNIVDETIDGYVIDDETFFNNFDLEEE